MSILYDPMIKSYGDKNSSSELMCSSSNYNVSQKRDDSSNSSIEPNEQNFSGGISTRWYTGKVKSFNIIEGYGFIACNELMQQYGCDVFMHKRQFFAATVSLRIGDNVRFRLEFSKQGKPQARQITRVAEPPVAAFLRSLSARAQQTEIEQVSILQPEQINKTQKRKVSFKELVEVCVVNDIVGDEANVDKQHVRISSVGSTKKKYANLPPAKKFSSLITWKEAKQKSCIGKMYTGKKKLDTSPVDRNKPPSKQVVVTPNRITDIDVTSKQTQDMSLVDSTNSKKMQTRKLISPRLEKRVISIDESPQTSELTTQNDKKTDEAVQPRLEDGVINGLLQKRVTKEAASIISKKDAKKFSRKRVTFRLKEDIINDSYSCWNSEHSLRQNKKRTGMMKNFGATVRRKVKNSSETGVPKGVKCSRTEVELEQDREKELARLASETFQMLQRVQNKSKSAKITLQPKLKGTKKNSDSNTNPAYLDWSLGFAEEESTTHSKPKAKGRQDELQCKNSNLQVQAECKIKERKKRKDPDGLRKRDISFSNPLVCRNLKPTPKVEWGPQVVLTEVQVRERESSCVTREGFLEFKEGYNSRRDDQEQCSDEFKTYREKRCCNRENFGQILNRQQTQLIQSKCEVDKKAVEVQSNKEKLLEREQPIRSYKFPRPLDRRKQRK